MTDQEKYDVLSTYRKCAAAVAWVELFICADGLDDTESGWDVLMTHVTSPDRMVRELRELLDEDVSDPDDGPVLGSLTSQLPTIRAEMDHPDFTTYIAGKMGCV